MTFCQFCQCVARGVRAPYGYALIGSLLGRGASCG